MYKVLTPSIITSYGLMSILWAHLGAIGCIVLADLQYLPLPIWQ